MPGDVWVLTDDERAVLGAALDALLPPEGSFPLPSETGLIDDFILRRVPAQEHGVVPYPRVTATGLRAILAALVARDAGDMTTALEVLHQERPDDFTVLWCLAVFGYYSRPETIAAIQRDLSPGYHGAPLPLGYNHLIDPWDPADPLQLPQHPRGSYVPTAEVRRVNLDDLRAAGDASREGGDQP
jgi:hypothetical protein